MKEIAPGLILQRMYIKSRLNKKYRTFCEIGSGNGHISAVLLKKGLEGKGFDLNKSACENNYNTNKEYIDSNRYIIIHGNAFDQTVTEKFDIIISCMVLEHLSENQVKQYFEFCERSINPGGRIIIIVPASMVYWGIEDEIAGHFKRFEFEDFKKIAEARKLIIKNLTGLTFPLSNILFSFSNKLVQKNEVYKKELTMEEQTILSGNRNVKYKTIFPWYFKFILNEITLFPFYILQRFFRNHSKSMVIYSEFELNHEI